MTKAQMILYGIALVSLTSMWLAGLRNGYKRAAHGAAVANLVGLAGAVLLEDVDGASFWCIVLVIMATLCQLAMAVNKAELLGRDR